MSAPPSREHDASSTDENAVRALYRQVLEGWNTRKPQAFTAPFAEDGEVIGFDGSQMSGSAEIAATLQQIFADHVTAPYVSKVRSVRLLGPDACVLHAIVGMLVMHAAEAESGGMMAAAAFPRRHRSSPRARVGGAHVYYRRAFASSRIDSD
jgi:uncharacterized protein (TIGR02246 family)